MLWRCAPHSISKRRNELPTCRSTSIDRSTTCRRRDGATTGSFPLAFGRLGGGPSPSVSRCSNGVFGAIALSPRPTRHVFARRLTACGVEQVWRTRPEISLRAYLGRRPGGTCRGGAASRRTESVKRTVAFAEPPSRQDRQASPGIFDLGMLTQGKVREGPPKRLGDRFSRELR